MNDDVKVPWRNWRYHVLNAWWDLQMHIGNMPFYFWRGLANRLPRKLVYHCAIRVFAHAHTRMPNKEVPKLYCLEALQVWSKDHEDE